MRMHTGFEIPHRIWESSEDLRILTGFENPERSESPHRI
jgi:hypothetical protein